MVGCMGGDVGKGEEIQSKHTASVYGGVLKE